MSEYNIEFCGADGKRQYRVYDAQGKAVCYAHNKKQAENVVKLLTMHIKDAARYRFLRDDMAAQREISGMTPTKNHWDDIDYDIDAAIEEDRDSED